MIINRILKVYKNSNGNKLATAQQQPIHIRSFTKISKWSNITNSNKLYNDNYNNDYSRQSISKFNNKFYNFTTSIYSNNNYTNSQELLEKELKKNESLINYYKVRINENPKIEHYYYLLYVAMRKCNMDFIEMINGEKLDLVQVLIKEIGNTQETNKLPYIELTRFLKDLTDDVIPVPYIYYVTKKDGSGEKELVKDIMNFNKIYLFVKAWEIDKEDGLVIDEIASYMVDYKKNMLLSMSGIWITDLEMCSLNYQINKNKFDRSSYLWLELSNVMGENVKEFNGKKYNSLQILAEGVEIFPEESRFYFEASKKLTNNYETLNHCYVDVGKGHPFYGKNRIDLLTQAIEFELDNENKTNRHTFYMSNYFYHLGLALDKLTSVNVDGQEWNRIKCFTKSIEMDSRMVLCTQQLIKELNIDGTIILNGESVTRQQLLLKMLDVSNNILSTKDFNQFIYKQLKQHSSLKYGKLLQLENQDKLKRILSIQDKVPEIRWTKYNQLISYINDTDGYLDKPIEFIFINNEKFTSKDLLIKLLSFQNLEIFYNFNINYHVFYNLSKELQLSVQDKQELSEDEQIEKEANLQITTLGGQTLTKADLVYNELKFSPNFSMGYHTMGTLTPNIKFQKKLNYFITSIKKDNNYGPSYFEIGKLLSSKHSNQTSVTILGKEYTIDQLFKKSLSLQKQ